MSRTEHWDSVYASRTDDEVSWTQHDPTLSLALIREVCPAGRIIDVGGGTSVLSERLLDEGHSVAVLDISTTALVRAKQRLGARANRVRWIVADITGEPDLETVDVWHDRAVFHFLTDPADRAAYRRLLSRTVPPGGYVIIATFALDGPDKCSGLPVHRYDPPQLIAELGEEFEFLKSVPEIHHTPWGKAQSFQYSAFRRIQQGTCAS